MLVFRELVLTAPPGRMAAIADQVERTPPAGWSRDRVMEAKVRSAIASSQTAFCFARAAEGDCGGAVVVVVQNGPFTFRVPNVVPIEYRDLSLSEYNSVLKDFHDRVIHPHLGNGVTAQLTDENAALERWLTPESANALRLFSSTSEKYNAAAHPRDRERWNRFVVAAHREGSTMDSVYLRRWLVEEGDWPEEIASRLAAEYELGRELLAFADGRRSA